MCIRDRGKWNDCYKFTGDYHDHTIPAHLKDHVVMVSRLFLTIVLLFGWCARQLWS